MSTLKKIISSQKNVFVHKPGRPGLVHKGTLITSLLLGMAVGLGPSAATGSEAVDSLLQKYQQQGAGAANPERGQTLWRQKADGRGCTSCHDSNPRLGGQHERTGKPIAPMAPSVNPERFQEVRQIRKWFYRNCKWTLGRQCTAQEKTDLLVWLSNS